MSNNERKGLSFLKGAVVGALAGAAAGVLFAPKSGKETREDIKKKAGELKEQAGDMYAKASEMLHRKVAEVKKLGSKIDEEKYKSLVGEVVAEFRNDRAVTADAARKLGEQLRKDWEKVKRAVTA